MKKLLLRGLLALSVSSFIVGCSDNNSDPSTDPGSTDNIPVPTSTSEATALVNAQYGPLQTLSSSYSFLHDSSTETTVCFEDAGDEPGGGGSYISQLKTRKDLWYPVKVFNRLYQSIAAANTAIAKISEASEGNVPGKNDLIGRAKFIRGYNYFQLVQFFGEVPIITTAINPSTEEKTVRRSIDDVYAQAVKDLTEARAALSQDYGKDGNGRRADIPSKHAVDAVLAKLYLTWGAKPLSQAEVEAIKTSRVDPIKPAVDAAKYAKAIEYANAVLNSGNYQLQDNFNDIWGVDKENNSEVIFSIQHFGDGQGDAQGNHQTHCGYTWPGDERAEPHIQYADISLENLLPDNDTRKTVSYVKYVDQSAVGKGIDTLTWPLSIVRPGKWIHASKRENGIIYALSSQPNSIDHIDFRLAEIYLIKAEAQWYTNTGDKGLAAINALRNRAGGESYKLTKITEEAIWEEWSNELAFEQKHWLNLVRWRTLISSILTKVPQYVYYNDNYGSAHREHFGSVKYNNIPADPTRVDFYNRIHKHLHAKVDNINGRFYRFPIPPAEDQTTDLGITPQNPGF